MMVMQDLIDRTIKEIWLKDIATDYNNDFLLKEDSLKNAFYYHIRQKLSDNFLIKNRVRIYTEFHLGNKERADIAIVRLKPTISGNEPLQRSVQDILAIIELKHKNELCGCEPFWEDVEKVKKYIKSNKFKECQFYLGFIHERLYPRSEAPWLSKNQQETWAIGKLTELTAFYEEETEYFETRVISYNDFNSDLNSNG